MVPLPLTINQQSIMLTPVDRIFGIAERLPRQEAIVDDNYAITYAQLVRLISNRVDQLQNKLGRNKQRQLIAIQHDKRINTIIDSLACLKLGHGFLNIPIESPKDRIKSILSTARPVIFIENTTVHACGTERIYPPDLAYTIFTSGTTGTPKGVMIGQRNLDAFLTALQQTLPTDTATRMLQYASFSFDASVWEIFATLSFGGTLILCPGTILASNDLAKFIQKHAISRALLTPLVAQTIIDKDLPSIKDLIVGGDAFPPKLLTAWNQRYQLWNAYGPTEASICVLMHKFKTRQEKVTLGHPLPGTELQLDTSSGELTIRGKQVGIGYIEQNAFHYFNEEYKTGDIIHRAENDTFVFGGRIDNQIKIRGYRMSIDEIQNAILSINEVDSCCVVDINHYETKSLYAFYKGNIDNTSLQQKISLCLPHYMVPASFTKIAEWPLSQNGKTDTKALRAMISSTAPQQTRVCQEEIVASLISIWQNVLDTTSIDIESNFFQLGGQSFQALQTIQHYVERFGVAMDLVTFFNNPTITEQIPYLHKQEPLGYTPHPHYHFNNPQQ